MLTNAQIFIALGAIGAALVSAIGAVWLMLQVQYTGRLADRDKSEQRAWELVTALRAEAAESNRVIDRLADTVKELRESIRETQRRR